jgi:hypothetical protein
MVPRGDEVEDDVQRGERDPMVVKKHSIGSYNCVERRLERRVLQGVPEAVLCYGFEMRGDAAFPPGCVGGLGDLGGEASELEEVEWLGDSSS